MRVWSTDFGSNIVKALENEKRSTSKAIQQEKSIFKMEKKSALQKYFCLFLGAKPQHEVVSQFYQNLGEYSDEKTTLILTVSVPVVSFFFKVVTNFEVDADFSSAILSKSFVFGLSFSEVIFFRISLR